MTSIAVTEIATQAAALRAELKEWERAFAAANEGKKAGRGDIKKAPEIAAKYKEYSRLKSQESAAYKKNRNENEKPHRNAIDADKRSTYNNKRKHSSPNGPEQHSQTISTSTPRKPGTGGIFQTPSKTRSKHPSSLDPYDSPSALRRLFSPSTHMQSSSPLKTAIGPTPQRDGKSLGLFDLLSESGGSTATPSTARIASIRGMDAQTPSKKRKTMDTIMEEDEGGEDQDQEQDTPRGARTPASEGKSYMLSALFATPTAWRYSSIVEDESSRAMGPQNNAAGAKHHQSPQQPPANGNADTTLETPSFLRRSTSGLYSSSTNLTANRSDLSPIPVRKPPQFVGKGLSQLVQGLRDMEEERLEDELDVLREIEFNIEDQHPGMGGGVEVPDSQVQGPTDTTAATGRKYKKKGQKRTTRLVRMRPVVAAKPTTTKPQSQSQSQRSSTPAIENSDGSDAEEENFGDDDDDDANLIAITETQGDGNTNTTPRKTRGRGQGKNINSDIPDPFENGEWDSPHSISEAEAEAASDSDFGSDPDFDVDLEPMRRGKSFSEKMKEAIGAAGGQGNDKDNGTRPVQVQGQKEKEEKEKEEKEEKENKKPSTRKFNPQAHANYRSLKIRNRGGKGRGGGYGGRFRRR
ncbi:DNA replication/checkpoint protein [Aspergillus varians]